MKISMLSSILLTFIITFHKIYAEDDPMDEIINIKCDESTDYYTCNLTNFDTTSAGYKFPEKIVHADGHTNIDVQKILTTQTQIISSFPIEIFMFPNVMHVQLTNVNMSELNVNFTNCDKLEWLDLQQNNLIKISSGILSNCKSLKGATFGFNKISVISEDAFYGLLKLEIIEFDNNRLVNLPDKLFSESTILRFLRFDMNLLVKIPDNLLENNPNLLQFPMENNPTLKGNLPKYFLANKKLLQTLFIQNIFLVNFPEGMFVNTTGLFYLFAGDNRVTRIKNGVFDDLRNLQLLDFQSNLIENIENEAFLGTQNLKKLTLTRNKLKYLNSKVFKHVPNLESLYVEGNPIVAISYDFFDVLSVCGDFKITADAKSVDIEDVTGTYLEIYTKSLYANIFQCEYGFHEDYGYSCSLMYPENIKNFPIVVDDVDQEFDVIYLTCSSNDVSKVYLEFFTTFKTIKVIDFSNKSLDDSSLINIITPCLSVKVLILNSNNFTTIPSEVMNFKNLIELLMTHNHNTIVNDHNFCSLESVKILDLSFNKIRLFKCFSFSNINLSNNPLNSINVVNDVEVLNLSNYNGKDVFTSFYENSFNNATKLRKLFMSNRKIKYFNDVEFADTLEVLDVSYNLIGYINFASIKGLEYLKYLNFSKNLLTEIFVETFDKLEVLEFLDLRNNQIEAVAEFSFQNLTELSELLLDYNFIKILFQNSFFGLQNLKNLSISNNKLKVLENYIFEPLLRLENLDLSMNFLTSFSIQKFGDTSSLKFLDISRNEIQIFSTNFTDFFPASTSIQMGFNECSDPKNCRENPKISCNYKYSSDSIYECNIYSADVLGNLTEYFIDGKHIGTDNSDDVKVITAESGPYLEFLPPAIFIEFPNLQILNFIRVKTEYLLEFFNCSEFRVVNLQGNSITRIFNELFQNCNKIEVLNLEDNFIVKISGESFNKLQTLNFLSLADNDIKELYSNTFDVNENLEILRINSNKIDEIDDKIFWMLRNLRNLSIHSNLINSLPENLLENLVKLEELEIQNLKLNSTIPNKIFKNNKNLKALVMLKNSVSEIEENLFETLENLEFLDLRDCGIQQIHENSFKNLKMLKILYLQNNFIEKIDEKLTENLESLQEFYLTGNKISKLDQNVLKNSKFLIEFYANKNLITEIHENLFQNCAHLEIMNFEENKISNLTSKSFENLKKLKIVNFNYNNISIIDPKIFENLTSLEIIFFHENRIPTLPPRMFENLRNLTKIDFSKNNLTSIKSETFQNSEDFLYEILQEIFLSKNFISSIETQSFKLMPNLRILELQYNQIKTLSTNMFFDYFLVPRGYISKIDVSYNLINKISVDFFEKVFPLNFLATGNVCLNNDYKEPFLNISSDFKKCEAIILDCRIETLDFSQHLKNFSSIAFNLELEKLPSFEAEKCVMEYIKIGNDQEKFDFEVSARNESMRKIKIVEFLFTNISFFPPILFQNFQSLKTLVAKNVHIKNLNKIQNCGNLEILTLDDNFGIDLGDRNLENCTNLKILSINNVNLTSVSPTTFYGLQSLIELRMENSKIGSLNFFLPNSLEILRLSGNNLNIDSVTFKNLPNLSAIHLDNYHGPQSEDNFDKFSLFSLGNLEILDISNRCITSQNFPVFPADKNNLKILKSSKNNFHNLGDQIFKNLTKLIEIHLENCNILYLSDLTFLNLQKIEVINLQNSFTDQNQNRISNLSTILFSGLQNLKILQLGGNVVQKINENVFKYLENLQILSIFSNKIQEIEQKSFLGLKNLEILDINLNFLNVDLHFDIFVGLKNLKELNLKNCNLKILPNSIIALKDLQILDISSNFLTELLFSPLYPHVTSIYISDNQISKINPNFFDSIDKSAAISWNRNPCTRNSQTVFNINDSTFYLSQCYQNFEILNFCEVKENEKFGLSCKISNSSFENLSRKSEVRYVFNKNKPLEIDVFTIFEVYENLIAVDFWKSSITNIFGIRNCESLKNFDLRLNLIENLYENLFTSCENLEKLILIKNQISFVDKNAFKGLKNLRILDLSLNLIEDLDNEPFIDNFEMEKLVLSYNKISSINSGLFVNLKMLKILKLDNNLLTKIEEPLFLDNQSKIHEIHLNSNKLTELSPDIFKNLNNLRYLNIERNQLKEIDLTKLNCKFLEYLDISFNNLSTILIDLGKFAYLRSFFAEKNFCIDENFENIGEKVGIKLKSCQNNIVKDEL